MKTFQTLDLDKVAAAIEADAGQALPGLRESLSEAKAGTFAQVHTPDSIAARRRGRPAGSTKTEPKVQTAIRFDPDVLAALRATGDGWQTRVNDMVRASLKLAGQLRS